MLWVRQGSERQKYLRELYFRRRALLGCVALENATGNQFIAVNEVFCGSVGKFVWKHISMTTDQKIVRYMKSTKRPDHEPLAR